MAFYDKETYLLSYMDWVIFDIIIDAFSTSNIKYMSIDPTSHEHLFLTFESSGSARKALDILKDIGLGIFIHNPYPERHTKYSGHTTSTISLHRTYNFGLMSPGSMFQRTEMKGFIQMGDREAGRLFRNNFNRTGSIISGITQSICTTREDILNYRIARYVDYDFSNFHCYYELPTETFNKMLNHNEKVGYQHHFMFINSNHYDIVMKGANIDFKVVDTEPLTLSMCDGTKIEDVSMTRLEWHIPSTIPPMKGISELLKDSDEVNVEVAKTSLHALLKDDKLFDTPLMKIGRYDI